MLTWKSISTLFLLINSLSVKSSTVKNTFESAPESPPWILIKSSRSSILSDKLPGADMFDVIVLVASILPLALIFPEAVKLVAKLAVSAFIACDEDNSNVISCEAET